MGISILAWLSSLGLYWGSRDDNQANMEMSMYYSVSIPIRRTWKMNILNFSLDIIKYYIVFLFGGYGTW